jgi:hypothetical protein
MATGNVARIIRAPGTVHLDPLNVSGPAFGGVVAGHVNSIAFAMQGNEFEIENEALGEVTDVLEGDNRFAVSFFARGFDDDAIEKLVASNYVLGAVSGHAMMQQIKTAGEFHLGSNVPGSATNTRGIKLLFVPDDTIHVPALLLYNAIPTFTEGAELLLQRTEELGLPITLRCLRDANGNTFQMGRLVDLDLTP